VYLVTDRVRLHPLEHFLLCSFHEIYPRYGHAAAVLQLETVSGGGCPRRSVGLPFECTQSSLVSFDDHSGSNFQTLTFISLSPAYPTPL
jgi:hypothetical protein